ncbi:hypothetical protein C7974DRAFT_404722 [Boeremia exigua]|uniref:uncharacterized protein n=1 Tax=Boeremia exigua TaxID=749465 RepID=UPI001E8DFECA|nr:uncharacterized protein C7974DRAFT_404722 [Boeremia exigua]KAH6614221.1 hypothetical protein C7974DRAFT_404722 [Boeremia exigua]
MKLLTVANSRQSIISISHVSTMLILYILSTRPTTSRCGLSRMWRDFMTVIKSHCRSCCATTAVLLFLCDLFIVCVFCIRQLHTHIWTRMPEETHRALLFASTDQGRPFPFIGLYPRSGS